MEQHNGLIVGFSGKMQTGKTTAAQYLVTEMGFTRKSFAEALRDITAYSFGCAKKQLTDGGFKKQLATEDLTWRDIMIRVGAFYRSIQPDFWVDRMDFSGSLVVIDDVRFENEAEKIKGLGGILIRMDREGPKLDDISETALDKYDGFDFFITNNGDFLQLYNRLDDFISPELRRL